MSKVIKIVRNCSRCAAKLTFPIVESDVGMEKLGTCPKCGRKISVKVPAEWAAKFESDPTQIPGGNVEERVLVIETIPNSYTDYQCFELTSEYYTIGRQNNSGPEHRPDVEVATTDRKMGRVHAVFKKKGKVGYTLMDMGSKNGVFLNGEKLGPDKELYLEDGDLIRLGETQFRVSLAEHVSNDQESTE